MKPWLRYLTLFVAAASHTPLHAQYPIATLTCSGSGLPMVSVPVYEFYVNLIGIPFRPVAFAFLLGDPSQLPLLLPAIAAGTAYGSCSLSNGVASFPLLQATIMSGDLIEASSGLVAPASVSYSLLMISYSQTADSGLAGAKRLPMRSTGPLNHQLDALIKRMLTERHSRDVTAP